MSHVSNIPIIGVDFGGSLGAGPNTWEAPMLLSVLTSFPPNLGSQYFWQVYASDCNDLPT